MQRTNTCCTAHWLVQGESVVWRFSIDVGMDIDFTAEFKPCVLQQSSDVLTGLSRVQTATLEHTSSSSSSSSASSSSGARRRSSSGTNHAASPGVCTVYTLSLTQGSYVSCHTILLARGMHNT
jgi:hypothetical protein